MRSNKVAEKINYDRIRNAIMDLLGNKCIQCGFSDKRALQIDHVFGGGSKERKSKKGRSGYRYILDKIIKNSEDYQLLCANCNWIKRSVNNENRK